MIKKVHFLALKLALLLLLNNKSVIRYSVYWYNIIHNTYKTNDRRGTAYQYLICVTISFTILKKLILLQVIWQITYAYMLFKFLHTLVLVTMLIRFHLIF